MTSFSSTVDIFFYAVLDISSNDGCTLEFQEIKIFNRRKIYLHLAAVLQAYIFTSSQDQLIIILSK